MRTGRVIYNPTIKHRRGQDPSDPIGNDAKAYAAVHMSTWPWFDFAMFSLDLLWFPLAMCLFLLIVIVRVVMMMPCAVSF